MSASNIATTHWALLIGINFYIRGHHLRGCVNDVKLAKKYLETEHAKEYLKTERAEKYLDVVTLTASGPHESNPRVPAESEELWPTYENLTSTLERITAEASPGNFVYIHYSGHGVELSAITDAPDVGFVLFDEERGERYFPSRVLSTALQKMVAKGLFVTVVLDCCFSGGTMRQDGGVDAGVRTVAYDPAIGTAYPRDVSASPHHQDTRGSFRDARVLPTWLVEPHGYTILTACGPTELAKELPHGGGNQFNGRLSFFLFNALARAAEVLAHEDLYHHLCGQFRSFFPTQNPMRYGDGELTFFGASRPEPRRAFIPVFARQGKPLCLSAGLAHGVHKDDEYTASNLKGANAAPVVVRVDAVRGLSSDLSVIGAANALHDKIREGWNAIPLKYQFPRNFHVRLEQVGNDLQWIEAMGSMRYLQLWTENGEGRIWDCIVRQNESNEYEILDDSRKPISSLPRTPTDYQDAMTHVLGLLEHMATFKTVKAIRNTNSSMSSDRPLYNFHSSWSLKATNIGDTHEAGRTDEDTYEIGQGDEVIIEVKNTSSRLLFLFLYSLGPSWQIESLISKDGGGDYMVMEPGKTVGIPLETAVPEAYIDRGEYECEDTVKVFVTNQWTSFRTFQLPEIPVPNPGSVPGQSRGDCGELSNPAPSTLPQSGIPTDIDEKWDVKDIVIRTHYRESKD